MNRSKKDLESILENLEPDWTIIPDIEKAFNNCEIDLEWIEEYLFKFIDNKVYNDGYFCLKILLTLIENGSEYFSEEFIEEKLLKKVDEWFSYGDKKTINDFLLGYIRFSEGFLDRNFERFDGDFNMIFLLSDQSFSEEFFLKYVDNFCDFFENSGESIGNLINSLENNIFISKEVKKSCISWLKARGSL